MTEGRRLSLGRSFVGTENDGGELCGVPPAVERLFSQSSARRCAYIQSVPDKDKTRARAFSEKATNVFVPKDTAMGESLEWVRSFSGYACKKGKKPGSPNQDNIVLLNVESEFALWGVFDGHGPLGHDVSKFARETLVECFTRKREEESESFDASKAFVDSFEETQQMIQDSPLLDARTSGSTCTMVYLDCVTFNLTVAHVGDSRAVLGKTALKREESNGVVDLTNDHKPHLPEEKQRIESAGGRVVFDGFYNHRVFSSQGNYPGLNMSRALGDVVAHKEAGLTATPDVKTVDIGAMLNDCEDVKLFICSDGVWEFMESSIVLSADYAQENLAEASQNLAQKSYDEWMRDSGDELSDDISIVLISLRRLSESSSARSAPA
jgi:serine/threonine protein phosphatase PrpC|eukprot:TRINITY_DN17395_c0_g1_i1.p1 TRINITY_DN17395_c0_g1~~TRINITY_DN17395_c0_g1_i1.p1  ORF type:complete len:406 (+),score=61.99 TRINITY_DN17395_c0_g1_i1:79-1218(+)